MTALNLTETQMGSGLSPEMIPSPQGWITTGIHVINLNEKKALTDEPAAGKEHVLSLAAKRTERLIEGLKDGLSIDVSVSYMRVERETMFHILLLIGENDFHSPKIVAARMLAEKFAKTEGYDIKFVFAIESENRMNHTIRFGGYKLMFKCGQEPESQTH